MYACSFLFPQRLARLASGCYLAVHRVHQRRSAGTHAHAAVHGCRDGELVCDSEGLVLSATPSAAYVLPFLSPRSVVMRDDKLETLAPSLCREKCNGHGYCMRYWADDKALPFCNCLRDFEVGGGATGSSGAASFCVRVLTGGGSQISPKNGSPAVVHFCSYILDAGHCLRGAEAPLPPTMQWWVAEWQAGWSHTYLMLELSCLPACAVQHCGAIMLELCGCRKGHVRRPVLPLPAPLL